jgi:Flp pilus assembly protein CpaB
MRSRGLVVAIAVVLAVAAAAAVVLYVQGVKRDAIVGGELQTVIVATQDVPANQRLDPLIEQGLFDEVDVPADALVDGAVRQISELEGATTRAQIFANEQIPSSRLSTGETQLNQLGISKGHVALTVELDAPQGGNGYIQPGDNVSVYATYTNIRLIAGTPQQIIQNPGRIPTGNTSGTDVPDFTVTIAPTVRVLAIQNPEVDPESGEQDNNGQIRLTLDLLPEDAQKVVFAKEVGLVWVGLLPPNEEGPVIDGAIVPLDRLLEGGPLR